MEILRALIKRAQYRLIFTISVQDARALTLGTEWRVTPNDTLLEELQQLLGKDQVELEFN